MYIYIYILRMNPVINVTEPDERDPRFDSALHLCGNDRQTNNNTHTTYKQHKDNTTNNIRRTSALTLWISEGSTQA